MILRCFRRECVVFLFSLFEMCPRWYFVLSSFWLSGFNYSVLFFLGLFPKWSEYLILKINPKKCISLV